MSHVTVVEVNESLIKNFVEEAALRLGVEDLKTTTKHKQECIFCQRRFSRGNVTQDRLCQCTVSKTNPKSEDLYANFNELQQRVYGMTTDTPSTFPAERRDLPNIHTSRGLVRKCSIIDQNVGVTGAVFMVSDPGCQQQLDTSDDESDSSLTSSVSSLSESDSGLSNIIEVEGRPVSHHATTIAIGENKLHNRLLLHIPGATEDDKSSESREHGTEGVLREVSSLQTNEVKVTDDSTDTTMTLEWRVIPPSSPILQQPAHLELEGDRGSTPTSFSSAYTVTELENESTSEDSEAPRHNWLGQDSDEELQGNPRIPNRHNLEGALLSISEDNSLPWGDDNQHLSDTNESDSVGRITSARHIVLDITGNTIKSVLSRAEGASLGCKLREELYRLRHTSDSSSCGGDSIVYSYIPCRDQREKEDEELWVANEAADPEGSQIFHGVAPPLLLPPWGWGDSLGGGSGKPEPTKRGPVWAEQLRAPHVCVTAPSCVSSLMCTLAPSLAAPVPVGTETTQRKHYSTRQRVVEPQIITVVDEEPKYKQNWNKLNNGDTETQSENLQTSGTTNMPTKRFSFLIRSNSVKKESVTDPNSVPAVRQPVTPSDQAILDKLATLNIEAPDIVFKPRTRCSLFEPPCVRCGEPVYLQERTEPTLRLVYHSSCFKCHRCGVRLTLKTFFRSPLDSKDSRVFCKSHVPSLDPGRLDPGRLDPGRPDTSSGKSSPDGTRPDTHSDTCRISSNSSHTRKMSLQDKLDIVKCDTIGLRYF
ncbi:uncharacterized protein [Procambarus clarkii]|uniref:uncharacterized protein n=1 Tax=Procambarus clarkii TaxID=6728 RepID=UPI003742AB2F